MENLSEHVIVLITLTEDGAVDRHGRAATDLVRDMRPEVAFADARQPFRHPVDDDFSDHLEAAGVDLSTQPLGYSLSFIVVEHGVVLQSRTQPLPNPTSGMDRAPPWPCCRWWAWCWSCWAWCCVGK